MRPRTSSEAGFRVVGSRKPHFSRKNCLIFQELAFFVLLPKQLTRESLVLVLHISFLFLLMEGLYEVHFATLDQVLFEIKYDFCISLHHV